jgi:CheY-like chemotaxis protein
VQFRRKITVATCAAPWPGMSMDRGRIRVIAKRGHLPRPSDWTDQIGVGEGTSSMPHALIIDENIAVCRAVQHYLSMLGFGSFDHTWTERQALNAARKRRPDIIVIGDDIEMGSAIRAARLISEDGTIPVLMVSGDPTRASQQLAQTNSYDGPFRLNQIEEAVEIALRRRCTNH